MGLVGSRVLLCVSAQYISPSLPIEEHTTRIAVIVIIYYIHSRLLPRQHYCNYKDREMTSKLLAQSIALC